jgi:hypothetical protein
MWACMCPGRTRGRVWADPNVDQIWDTNGSRADRLSVWVARWESFYLFFVRADTFGQRVVEWVAPLEMPLLLFHVFLYRLA